MRLLKDDNEEMVLVYELVGPLESDPRTLIFEWGRSALHLDKFPANWRNLKDDALLGLRHH